MHIGVHVDAGHDTSGNPRRGTIVIDTHGDVVAFVEEGYQGQTGSLKHAGFKDVAVAITYLAITPGQYRELKKNDPR